MEDRATAPPREAPIGPFTLRGLAIAATAIAAGIGAGRTYLRTRVEAQKESTVQAALADAREEVKAKADAYISTSLAMFWRRIVVKAGLLALLAGGLWALGAPGHVTGWSVAAILASFLFWDAIVAAPTVRIIASSLKRSGYKPRAALGSAVAAHVFAGVMARSADQPVKRTQTLLLVAAGTSADSFKSEVAEAVSTLAGEASWRDLRPFLRLAATKAGIILALYSAFVWGVLFIAN